MARSKYVYVVVGRNPQAAFTVKHELVKFLETSPELLPLRMVYRLEDNGSPFHTYAWDAERFLEENRKK